MTGCTIGGNQVTLWTRMLALFVSRTVYGSDVCMGGS